MSKTVETGLEQTYPSIELAYPIAVASYDTMARRLDTVDGRLQTILALWNHLSSSPNGCRCSRSIFQIGMVLYGRRVVFVSMIIGTGAREVEPAICSIDGLWSSKGCDQTCRMPSLYRSLKCELEAEAADRVVSDKLIGG